MSFTLFIAVLSRNLKLYFEPKESKVDYSKNIWKEGRRGHCKTTILLVYGLIK